MVGLGGSRGGARRIGAVVGALALVALGAACGGVERAHPLPAELVDRAEIPGIPDARVWADDPPQRYAEFLDRDAAEVQARFPATFGQAHTYLSVSGGGADGAFGAGLLCGWTEAGTRPRFTIVSGVSTGALIAPFAFLGPEYDDRLREIYTSYSTEDLARKRPLWRMLTSDGALDTTPLAEKIRQYYDQEVLDAIAAETRRGRALLIGTTNLDAQRPVIWNVGRIAQSDAPDRLRVFQDVILASASIPGAFPPVYFEVEADGARYDEMHVDGGATSQLFLYPIGMDWERFLELMRVPSRPQLYVVRNSKLSTRYAPARPRALVIAGLTISSLMRTSGYGDMYRTYLAAVRDGLDYHLASIPDEFAVEPQEAFDGEYMQQLFAYARGLAVEGFPWRSAPPGVDVVDDGAP